MPKSTLVKDIKAELLEQLKTKGMDFTMPWFRCGLPQNAFSKKYYRGGNLQHLDFVQRHNKWNCNQWGTFKQWSSKGHKIKKGSKGTQVYFWELKDKDEAYLNEKERAVFLATKKLPKVLLQKFFIVFNGYQIENYDIKKNLEHVKKMSEEAYQQIDASIEKTQANIIHHEGDAFYVKQAPFLNFENLQDDTIYMPHKENFFTDQDYYSTLLHELTHWSMTKERTNRVEKKLSYAEEELVAEIGSAFLCAYLGVEKKPRPCHAKYLNSWLQEVETKSERDVLKYFTLAQQSLDFFMKTFEEEETKEVA